MKPISTLGSSLTRRLRYTNIFAKVPMAPPDPILGINIAYANDIDNRKVNLGVGAYRDDNLKPVVFSVVRKVEEQLFADKTLNMVYKCLLRNTFPLTASQGSLPAAKSSSSARITLF